MAKCRAFTFEYLCELGWGLIPMSIANYAVGLTFTTSASLIPIARFRCRRSDPKDTANLARTLDRLLKKNQLGVLRRSAKERASQCLRRIEYLFVAAIVNL